MSCRRRHAGSWRLSDGPLVRCHRRAGNNRAVGAAPFDFESLSEVWLRSKPGRKWHHAAPRLAAWVADMDYPPAPAIIEHLRSILDSGDIGYPERGETGRMRSVDAFVQRMHVKHGWSIAAQDVREWNDVVQSIQAFLSVICEPGDRVIVHTPAYPPFFNAIEQTRCELHPVPAVIEGDDVSFDHDRLDAELSRQPARVLLLCNPQNPTGRVFTRTELEQLAAIADRHDLIIVSDEIHGDILFDGRTHIPMATIPGAATRTITLNSASKSFNIAGLHYAVSHCGVPWVEERLASKPDHLFGAANIMGAEGAWAAWTKGDEWFAEVRTHLEKMRGVAVGLVRAKLPGVKVHVPQATYLAWLDCTQTSIADDPYTAFQNSGVEVSDGVNFGPGGEGHVRLNFATSTSMLEKIVSSMAGAL